MVKSGSEGAGTMRATGTMSDGAQTMIEHGSTMLESDLGTMVINSDDEDEEEDVGSMRSRFPLKYCTKYSGNTILECPQTEPTEKWASAYCSV